MNKQSITDQIGILKNQIQDLIDAKKGSSDKKQKESLENDKKGKILQLKGLNEKLKEIDRNERTEKQRQYELRSASRAVDSLEFGAAKKKNNPLALDNAKKSKQLREEAREKYMQYLEKEKEYLEKDPVELPSYLFLHNNVIKEYSLCPYLKFDECATTEQVYNQRSEWLKTQHDNGKIYFDILDDLLNKKELVELQNEKSALENELLEFIKENLNTSDYDLYTQSDIFIKEFSETQIKSKRLKERLRQVIHYLSVLYAETGFEIHTYLSIKYDEQIDVNAIESTRKNENSDTQQKMQRLILSEKFIELLSHYKLKIDSVQLKQKYITNTLKNLKLQLYNFLTTETEYTSTKNVQQIGKYFKRWITLTKDEQFERFESFCHYYVTKNNLEETMISKLYELLKESFLTKKMVYRDYTWNTTKGIIENVKILHYDKEQNDFVLKYTKKDKTTLKKASNKTVLSGENIEKTINEELLYFIVKRLNNGESEEQSEQSKQDERDDKESKNLFIEHLKLKLKIKKLSNNDKDILYKKYDEMLYIVGLTTPTRPSLPANV